MRWDLYVIAALALWVYAGGPIQRQIDRVILDPPLIEASIEVIRNADGEVAVRYDADPIVRVSGDWIATIYSASGVRIATRVGRGNYSADPDEPKEWAWKAFFETPDGAAIPTIPPFPFQVCVRYSIETRRSGLHDDTPNYCSATFDPKD